MNLINFYYFNFLKSLSSGNEFIDKFIQEQQNVYNKTLKWFPYDTFKNVKYLDKGGFSIVYTATWSNNTLVLKSLNNSNEDLSEILNEVIIYFIFNLIIIYLLIFIYL